MEIFLEALAALVCCITFNLEFKRPHKTSHNNLSNLEPKEKDNLKTADET